MKCDPEDPDFATARERDIQSHGYKHVVVALYPHIQAAQAGAELEMNHGISPEDIAIVVRDGELRESIDRGVSLMPPAVFAAAERSGARSGLLAGVLSGIVLDAELLLLGAASGFTLPALAGVVVVAAVLSSVANANFRGMDLGIEGTDYSTYVRNGGALLVVFTTGLKSAIDAEQVLTKTKLRDLSDMPSHPTSPASPSFLRA